MKKTNFLIKLTLLTTVIGISLAILNLILLKSLTLSIVSIIIIPVGPFFYQYKKYRENKEIEERFPDFLRDVAQNIRTGMTIPQAIMATKNSYYGALTPYINKIIVQIDWGVPLDKILTDFANHTTKSLRRTVSTIIDTHKGGGDIADIFDSVGKSTVEINRINKERSSIVYNQMLTGYIIFFVFIGVLIMMQIYLIPSLQTFSAPEVGISSFEDLGSFYADVFRMLIIIQGFFSGLVIGKLSEGSIISGLKHSIFLVIIGSLALLIFI
jgi:flagellar protein FlaJ